MSLRPIKALNMAGVIPGGRPELMPEMEWVDPTQLVIDETYQRNLSEASVTLIRKIVANWSWSQFKAPTVAHTDAGLEVIDGQHTAIAAASHPTVNLIPVLINSTTQMSERAAAFVGANRNRLGVTAQQLFYASVAAGDEDALTTVQVCQRAGIRILKYPPGNQFYKPGDTMATAAIKGLVIRRGAMRARESLQVLARADLTPVRADHVKAVEMLCHDSSYTGQFKDEDLTMLIRARGPELERAARVFCAVHKLPLWRGLVVEWFRNVRHGHRTAA